MRSFSGLKQTICDIGIKISFCVKLQGFETNFHGEAHEPDNK